MTSTTAAEAVILGMWDALYDHDWETLKGFLAEDCLYADMPVGPAFAARGPADIIKRLRIAFDRIPSYVGHSGLILSNGSDVMYEHSETWTWADETSAYLRFVSVHRVVDGKITVWKDYWDLGMLRDQAPADWFEDLGTVDMSWVYDATGQL